jgi:hypothetical protein
MSTIILTILIVIAVCGLSYLGTVGIVALVQWLCKMIFLNNYDYNIWLLGLLVWILLIILKSTFNEKHN